MYYIVWGPGNWINKEQYVPPDGLSACQMIQMFCQHMNDNSSRADSHFNYLYYQPSIANVRDTKYILDFVDGLVPDSKVHEANMGPNWVLSASDGPHVGPMKLAIRSIGANADHGEWLAKRLIRLLPFMQNDRGYPRNSVALRVLKSNENGSGCMIYGQNVPRSLIRV